MSNEIWKPIIEDDRYEVSNLGRVRSVNRVILCWNGKTHCKKNIKGKIKKPQLDKWGYLVCGVGKNDKKMKVHRLVAQAFIPNPLSKPEINHKDLNKINNTPSNLEWCSSKENLQHAWKAGIFNNNKLHAPKGEQHGSSKLTPKQVKLIRKMKGTGKELGKLYGVSQTTISLIKRRKLWRHIL